MRSNKLSGNYETVIKIILEKIRRKVSDANDK